MSIIQDLNKYRKYKCLICLSTETHYDKTNKKFRWYKTRISGEVGFWCDRCYKRIYRQVKYSNNGNKTKTQK